ncbi:MAG: N(4)-(beta-N-acetylglucosaminyl)-L-asparaginase [Chloroflexota bacterium]
MIIVASENGRKGAVAAMALMKQGGSALDAVELACRVVEDDPAEQSVGYGGLPNLLGDVELDASIMDGRDLRTGAVAAVRHYGNVISIARHVMDQLPHVLLVGRGAEQFAAEMGESPANQRTDDSMGRWRERYVEAGLEPVTRPNVPLRGLATQLSKPLNLSDQAHVQTGDSISEQTSHTAKNPEANGKDDTQGTVNFLAIDDRGDMASAVSTSGLGWKYPSRVGDSPIIGAGNYCDNRYGAAACTGSGELAIRVSTARSLVLYLKMGMSIQNAGLECLRDLTALKQADEEELTNYMNIVALSSDGNHEGFTSVPGKLYLYFTDSMNEPELSERTCLPR